MRVVHQLSVVALRRSQGRCRGESLEESDLARVDLEPGGNLEILRISARELGDDRLGKLRIRRAPCELQAHYFPEYTDAGSNVLNIE